MATLTHARMPFLISAAFIDAILADGGGQGSQIRRRRGRIGDVRNTWRSARTFIPKGQRNGKRQNLRISCPRRNPRVWVNTYGPFLLND